MSTKYEFELQVGWKHQKIAIVKLEQYWQKHQGLMTININSQWSLHKTK